jgi:hypothetical protein
VHSLCRAPGGASNQQRLYQHLTAALTDHIAAYSVPALEAAKRTAGDSSDRFLTAWAERWRRHLLVARGCSHVFQYLVRAERSLLRARFQLVLVLLPPQDKFYTFRTGSVGVVDLGE